MDITLPDGSTITIPDPAGVTDNATSAPVDTSGYQTAPLTPVDPNSAQAYSSFFASPAGGGSAPSQATYDTSGNVTGSPASSYGATGSAFDNYTGAPATSSGSSGGGGFQLGPNEKLTPTGNGQMLAVDTKSGMVRPVSFQPPGGNLGGALSSIMNGDFKGALNDPKGLAGVLALLGAAGTALAPKQQPPTPAQLMGQLPPQPYNNFTPANQALMDGFSKNFMPKVKDIRAATYKNYAGGGTIVGWEQGGIYGPTNPPVPHPKDFTHAPMFASGGALSNLVGGPGSGQQDNVKAHLSPGEYVMDADTVSNLGDGSNEAGAKVLDQVRQRIRAHKRAAPASKIPPKAKTFDAYLKGGRTK